jgi:hypothetical protein
LTRQRSSVSALVARRRIDTSSDVDQFFPRTFTSV